MSFKESTRRQGSAAPGRQSRKNFDPAHRAIHEGGRSLGEIASMVQDDPMDGDRFLRDDLPDLIEFKPLPIAMWDQVLFGMRFKSAFSTACVGGVVAGIFIGYKLYGGPVHASIVTAFPFLG